MTDADRAAGGLAASAIETDIDMSGVDPLRYAEMRRRVTVIRKFIATERTPKDVREAFAAQLGVGEKHFMRLVAAWQALGAEARAAELDAATGGKGGQRKRRGGLSAEARAIVTTVIADLGSDAPLATTLDAVRRLAADRRVKAPGRSSVWNMLMEARSQGASSRREAGIVIGTVHAKLPVTTGSGVTYPTIELSVRSPDGAILTYGILFGPEDAVEKQRTLPRAPERSAKGVSTDSEGRHRLATLLGRRIAGLGIIHQPSLASPAVALLRSRRDAPISPDDARRLIAAAITEHNQVRAADPTDSDSATVAVPKCGNTPEKRD